MHAESASVIAWARKRLRWFVAGGLFLLSLTVALFWYHSAVLAPQPQFSQSIVRMNDQSFEVDIADTIAEREKGLSGRATLTKTSGMLFVFEEAKKHCFWMKDTHFPLDIAWFNEAKQLVHIEKSVMPDSYPSTSFCPQQAALYVLEVPAGELQAKVGDEFSVHNL